MATTRVIRYEVLEIIVPTGSTSLLFNFPDQPQLRDARIVGMEVYTPSAVTATPISGGTPVALADLQKTSISLYVGNLQQIDRMPVLMLNRTQDSVPSPFQRDMQLFQDLVVSWTKSFVTLASAIGTANRVYCFGVYFWLPESSLQNKS